MATHGCEAFAAMMIHQQLVERLKNGNGGFHSDLPEQRTSGSAKQNLWTRLASPSWRSIASWRTFDPSVDTLHHFTYMSYQEGKVM